MQQTLYMYSLDNYRRILGYGSLIKSKNLDCVAVTRVLEMKLTFFFLNWGMHICDELFEPLSTFLGMDQL